MILIPSSESVPEFWIDIYEYPNIAMEKPRSATNLFDAMDACQAAGKRLCTAAEWRRACLGPEGKNRFGYGPTMRNGRCNQSPQQDVSQTSLMNETDEVAPSGSFSDCHTPEGVFDMIGNVEEWTLDSWRGVGGMLEGGATYTYDAYADCSGNYSRQPDYRLLADQNVFSAGFRCCQSEVPVNEALVNLDAQNRLEQKSGSRKQKYNPKDEVEILAGVWMDRFEYPNRRGEYPLTAVSWQEASSLCQEHGKRLCSVYEWEQGCSGPEGHPFPYGARYVKAACAMERTTAAMSGEHWACMSSNGARDMVGSVWEWTATPMQAKALTVRPGETLREIRGGAWGLEPIKGTCRPSDGYPAAPEDMRYPDLGFRCCRGKADIDDMFQPWSKEQKGCPERMANMGSFCMDQYEYPNIQASVPIGNLDYLEARQVCETVGKRICTEAEWVLACSGPSWRGYPYGNHYASERCAIRDDGRLGGRIAASGSHPSCATPEGVFDMSGNLWEWVETVTEEGALRGGGRHLSAGMGRCRSRALATEEFSSAEAGVRCCAELQD